jgi:hypothetical protein
MSTPSTPELHTRFRRKDEVPWKILDDTVVILDLTEGDFFELDEIGGTIWKNLDGARTLDEQAQVIAAEYDVDVETVRADVVAFIADLDTKGLVVIAD